MTRYAKPNTTIDELQEKIENAGGIYEVVYQSQIQKDLTKISFDCENLTEEDGEFAMEGFTPGYSLLPNDVPVLWIGAGGDWECPLAFCVYIGEDNRLRAYVPKDGNVYNKKEKAAYGNNDDYDEYENYEFDMEKLAADAASRIVIR
jgi:TolA-binding protein